MSSARPSPPNPHRLRGMAESFGTDPARYDRTRQPYPDPMVQRIVAALAGTREVLDVGCGTGIEARQFRAAGCAVLGVEPDDRMAEFARRTGIEVEIGRFEDWDARGRRFDAVLAGTAWHWVDPVRGATKAAEVLRAGGWLAPFWHVHQLPAEVADALIEVHARVVPDAPFGLDAMRQGLVAYQAVLTRAADGMRTAGGFAEPEQWQFDWQRSYTRDEWLDQLPTTGAFTRLSPEALAQVLDGVGAAIDALGGSFVMSYATVVVAAQRAPK